MASAHVTLTISVTDHLTPVLEALQAELDSYAGGAE